MIRRASRLGLALAVSVMAVIATLAFLSEVDAQSPPRDAQVGRSFQVPYRLTDTNHFLVRVRINGKGPFNFLVDTGASAIALTPDDARKLGFDMAALNYGYRVVTAGGSARAAAVKLASVTVAGARVDDVDALVIEKGLDASLLGMSYLGRLASFQATRETLVLQP